MIVIASYPGSPFIQGCLESIPEDLPYLLSSKGGYECGALREALNLTCDEFFFMQDSARIKDPRWLYEILKDKGTSYSVNNETGWNSMFTGKYRMEILRQIKLPVTETKLDAVIAEVVVGKAYLKLDPKGKVLWPEMCLETAKDGEIFGRPVKIYENEHFLKYKSCWGGWMVQDCCLRDQAHRQKHS